MHVWWKAILSLATLTGFGFLIARKVRLGAVRRSTDHSKVELSKVDCYFDPECHALVDWDKITKLKMGFFKRLKHYKEQNSPQEVKSLSMHMHLGFAAAGMPEDRIDYILTKWVESVYPESLEVDHSSIRVTGLGCEDGYGSDLNQEYTFQGIAKDGRPYYRGTTRPDRYIYYDSYCADDTPEPRWLLGGKPDVRREKDLNVNDGEGCENDFSIVSDSKHIPGGIQETAWQWCGDHGVRDRTVVITYENKVSSHKEVSKKDDSKAKKYFDPKDCYFDKECHDKVDWEKIGAIKKMFFAYFKTERSPEEVEASMERARRGFAKAGMPEDRIDYILEKWLKFAVTKEEAAEEVDQKDCYFDKACHDKVDWEKIERMKDRFFAYLKTERSPKEVEVVMKRMHVGFAKAGMPEDRIDYILEGWLKFAKEHEPKKIDQKDCYFDKECHDKVDWEKIGAIKRMFFAYFKTERSPEEVEASMERARRGFVQAGMPEDRIDYILKKWMKTAGPKEDPKKIDQKDCYFDKACHDKVDWEKIERMKDRFFAYLKTERSPKEVEVVMKRMHVGFAKAGMPEDRIDYILEGWLKFAKEHEPKKIDQKDCYFDKECHDKVDWEKIGAIKRMFFAYFKTERSPEEVEASMERARRGFVEAGMPEDRIDYILKKWMKTAGPKEDPKKIDQKDCYFDKACHDKVDWEKIGEVKKGFFARLKYYKEQNDSRAVRTLVEKTRPLFSAAGMPADRIDYILNKWVKYVYPEAVERPTSSMATKTAEPEVQRGTEALVV